MNKSLPLERTARKYLPAATIPSEYQQILLPQAGYYFRQDHACDILSQHLLLGPYSVWLHDILAKGPILLRSFTPIPVFVLQFMFEDSLPVPRAGYILEERECNGFYLTPGQLYRMPMNTGKKIFSFHINIEPLEMEGLAKKYPQVTHLTTGIHPKVSASINNHPYHINAVCDMLVRKIMTCKYTGVTARHFLQRCCTDILLNYAKQHIDSQTPFIYTSMLRADTYHNLFNYLSDHPHKVHPLPEISYMYNIPVEELEHGFEQHFAISIADYLHMGKMMMIWHAIQENAFPLEEIAKVTNYKQVASMLEAVEEYYGFNPVNH
ncbi:hypothetical protein SIO70_00725 [Chitinophaga sancti]|uniref:hypothetical protein n=1 Tax=Chitinophaga sancti TaxID=1004 RepID=UPI002A75BB9D|nr:hypothetical protein [Chitinophaga sancti]WPQ63385.1 hypothetical protein SIO70_00725 [Chitinophaga sancti]